MNWLRKIRERREADRQAIANSRALLQDMIATEPEDKQRHRQAVQGLVQATEQAKALRATDTRNHYSESLTHAFRGGKPA